MVKLPTDHGILDTASAHVGRFTEQLFDNEDDLESSISAQTPDTRTEDQYPNGRTCLEEGLDSTYNIVSGQFQDYKAEANTCITTGLNIQGKYSCEETTVVMSGARMTVKGQMGTSNLRICNGAVLDVGVLTVPGRITIESGGRINLGLSSNSRDMVVEEGGELVAHSGLFTDGASDRGWHVPDVGRSNGNNESVSMRDDQDAPPPYTPTPVSPTTTGNFNTLQGTYGNCLDVPCSAQILQKLDVGNSMTCQGDLTIEQRGKLTVGHSFSCLGNVRVKYGATLVVGSSFKAAGLVVDTGASVDSGSTMSVRTLSGQGKVGVGSDFSGDDQWFSGKLYVGGSRR